MNESDTRLHKIDPKLKQAGWGMVEGSRITTEYTFTRRKISQLQKAQPKRATTPIERKKRAERIKGYEADLSSAQKAFVEYLTNAYIQAGVDELGKDKYRRSLLLSSAQSQKASATLAVPHRHDRPSRTSRGDSM